MSTVFLSLSLPALALGCTAEYDEHYRSIPVETSGSMSTGGETGECPEPDPDPATDTGECECDPEPVPLPEPQPVPDRQGCTLDVDFWAALNEWPIPAEQAHGCNMSYQEILATPAEGNAWFILGHQYIAAKLNLANGATAPLLVSAAIAKAESTLDGCAVTDDELEVAVEVAAELEAYNTGDIGPGYCSAQ